MASNFERSPQDDDKPFGGGGGSETGYLASLYNAAMSSAAAQRTQSLTPTVVTDLLGNVITATIPVTQSTTETLIESSQGSTDSVNYFTVTKSASSVPPTTFATTTSDAQHGSSSVAQYGLSSAAGQTANAEPSSAPISYEQTDDDGGLSDGKIAAATIVPVVSALLIAMCFLLLRRRNKAGRDAPRPNGSVGRNSFFGVGLKEKWGSLRSSASSQKEPIVTSHSNHAYMTGLDTSSCSRISSQQTSGEFYATGSGSDGGINFLDAPPPYIIHSNDPHAPALPYNMSDMNSSNLEMAQLSPTHQRFPPFHPSLLLAPASLDPPQSSARSARSISSDAYSDTASIHSARAARMSICGPAMIDAANASHSRIGSLRGDPFDDPSSPAPSLPTESRRTSDGSERRRR